MRRRIKATGAESPTSAGIVRNTLKGTKRKFGTASVQKAPVLTSDIREMVAGTDARLIGLRDRALILLGFAGAFRRSEMLGWMFRIAILARMASHNPPTQQDRLRRAGAQIGIPSGMA